MHEIKGSSSIKGIDMRGTTLRVTFQSGACYDYEGVPQETMLELLQADSVGSYFAKEIRPNFEGVRLTEDEINGNEPDTGDGGAPGA